MVRRIYRRTSSGGRLHRNWTKGVPMTSDRPDPSQYRRKPKPAPDFAQDVAQGGTAATTPQPTQRPTPPSAAASAVPPADSSGAEVTVQLNVRVSRHVAAVLDHGVAVEKQKAQSEGRTERITKRSALEYAILNTWGQ